MADSTKKHHDLFISYAKEDKEWVQGYLIDALEQAGLSIWCEENFSLGAPRLLEFERAIQHSSRILLVLSPAYRADRTGQFTDLLVQHYGIETDTWPVIPLILHEVKLPPRLSMLMALDATEADQWPNIIRRLCEDLKRPIPGPPLEPPKCPYPGMRAFQEQDSTRFYGRDQEIEELLQKLRKHNFQTVIGPSGSGKSSLVFAGLIPSLRTSNLFGTGDWVVRTIRPSPATLSTVLGGDLSNPGQTVSKLMASQSTAERLLLFVDQFEEIFSQTVEDADLFQQELLGLINVSDCYVVLTVRADFYPELMESPLWREIRSHRQEVVPLDEKGLREAILRPAEDAQVFIEATLLDRLLGDAAGEPGMLPLIQETLVLLWEKLERHFLPLKAYKTLVLSYKSYRKAGENKNVTGLQVAIAYHADAVYHGLAGEQQVIARRMFLRLIQFGDGRSDARRQQSVAALRSTDENPELFNQTLECLIDKRLLTSGGEGETRDRKVDISHEALIEGWPQLQEWITERREAEQTRRRLKGKAVDWVRLDRRGGLLDEAALANAETWLNSTHAAELGYDKVVSDFIEASKKNVEDYKRRRRVAIRAVRAAIILFSLLIVLAGLAANQSLYSKINTINAFNESSSYLFVENRKLDALIASVKAGQLLKNISWLQDTKWLEKVPGLKHLVKQAAYARIKTIGTFQQVVYGSHERNRLVGHSEKVNSVAFHPKGQSLVSGSDDGTLRLWRTDGEPIKTVETNVRVTDVAFNPPGNILFSAHVDGTVRLWSLTNGLLQKTLQAHINNEDKFSGWVNDLAFTRDERLLATASRDKTVKLWRFPDLSLVKTFQGHKGWVNGISFSPDGTLLASASEYRNRDGTAEDKTVRLWNTSDGSPRPFPPGHEKRVTGLTFSPDGKYLASASGDSSVALWTNMDTSDPVFRPIGKHGDEVTSVQFNQAGDLLVSTSNDGTLKLWQKAKDDWTHFTTLRAHIGIVTDAKFSPDSRMLVSSSTDKTIRLWGTPSPNPSAYLFEIRAALSPDGEIVVGSGTPLSGNKVIHFCQNRKSSLSQCRSVNTDFLPNTIVFSPDGRILASGGDDHTIRLWEPKDGTPIKILKEEYGHTAIVNSVSFHPDGKILASGSEDNTVLLWNIDKGTPISSPLLGHQSGVTCVVFSPDGKLLASGSYDDTVRLWKLNDSLDITFFNAVDQKGLAVTALSFSPNGKMLAVANQDNTIKLWQMEDASLLRTISVYQGGVASLAFSPAGNALFSGSSNNKIMIWDPNDGSLLQTIERDPVHLEPVRGLSFSRDGRFLMSASDKSGVFVWSLDLDDLFDRGCVQLQDYLKTRSEEDDLCDQESPKI